MKTYIGTRTEDGCIVEVQGRGALNPRLDLFNHSPTGFEWGYGGSGPAQLALALLADTLKDDKRAVELHQKFKFAVIGPLTAPEWSLTEEDVRAWVAKL